MEIRSVRPAEAAAVGVIVVDAYRTLLGPLLDDPYAAELADVSGRAAGADVLVAVEGGRIVGSVTYVADLRSPSAEQLLPGEAGIRMLAVEPRSQGGGAGRALVRHTVERARAARRTALVLHSTTQMVVAHHLYESLGFVRTPERDWEPVPGLTLLAFRIALDPPAP